MEKEKSVIEKLKDFALKTHRKIDFSEKAYPSNALHPVSFHRRFVSIPDNDYKRVFFACFEDSRKLDNYSVYSGVFFPIDVSNETKICVRKKHMFDKMSLFGKKQYYKTGVDSFDSQVVFDEFTAIGTNKIFTNDKIQNLILKVFDFDARLRVGINMLNLDFMPELKGRSYIGIYTSQNWFTNSSEIEILYDLAEQLQKQSVFMREPDLVAQF
ncbi:hypothetical protein [Marinifilum flexuosum]|uniref:Uncharacterized protein n=1 Tax=Marinifilum flexuosum TaxID=1117708 RepID=A0A419WKP1_9BACT|nr:hypothetical protein [Marinifilum flexuosum]RKD96004.1 hypothetical protein BXY64_3992 [Marinifilum flexuosum]